MWWLDLWFTRSGLSTSFGFGKPFVEGGGGEVCVIFYHTVAGGCFENFSHKFNFISRNVVCKFQGKEESESWGIVSRS